MSHMRHFIFFSLVISMLQRFLWTFEVAIFCWYCCKKIHAITEKFHHSPLVICVERFVLILKFYKKKNKIARLHERTVKHEGYCIIQWKKTQKKRYFTVLSIDVSSQHKMENTNDQLFLPLHTLVNIEAEENLKWPIRVGSYFHKTYSYNL